MNEHLNTFRGTWKQRIRSLQNVPQLLSIVWNSGRSVVVASMLGRVVGAFIPVSMLAVSKRILDAVQGHSGGRPLPPFFWYLVAAEAGLAVVSSLIGRATSYFDGLLADRFTRHVSIRVMQHAS
jgi:ATP-binding cassette subfamily B protein